MDISGSWSFIIRGDNIEMDQIIKNLPIVASNVILKGEVKNKVIGASHHDIWIYKLKYENEIEVIKTISDFLRTLKPHKDYIKFLTEKFDVVVRLYIQSDFAQIGLSFPSDVLRNLSELNVRMELSILSWGGVKDN